MNDGDIVKKNVAMTAVRMKYKTSRVADRAMFPMSYWIVRTMKLHASTLLDACHCLLDHGSATTGPATVRAAKQRSSISVSSMVMMLQ
jgi:hypothetical protein